MRFVETSTLCGNQLSALRRCCFAKEREGLNQEMQGPITNWLRRARAYAELTSAARAEHRRDKNGLPSEVADAEQSIRDATAWLCRAQDCSATNDGGVARHFSLLTGWGPSYPETTGYIIPTLIDAANRYSDPKLLERAKRMLDWLVAIQLPCGGFQGGTVDAKPVVPVTFNTGQILIGLAAGVKEFGHTYVAPMTSAAEWLKNTQDADGCWRKHPTPFAASGEKTYETHVAWGLFEAARIDPRSGYAECAMRNVRWALNHQRQNGWLSDCCLNDPSQPLTHTLGYALRGLLEAYRFTGESDLLDAAKLTASGISQVSKNDGFLPGRLDAEWRGTVPWACLTGTVQIAHCWLMLYEDSGDSRFLDAASKANRYVRSITSVSGSADTRGAVKGSFPISGDYCQFEYPNWACKFFIDAHVLELRIKRGTPDTARIPE